MPLHFPTLHHHHHQVLAPFASSKSHSKLRSRIRDPYVKRSVAFGLGHQESKLCCCINGANSSFGQSNNEAVKKRKVVEHILLLRAKEDISDVEEKDMLDNLYTSQYQMRGILAISLGRIEETNEDKFTHAVYLRFQSKEDLSKFYANSYYSQVLEKHVIPYCYGTISVDYESEVEDDILPIFRRGEDFNSGAECIILLSTIGSALGHGTEDAIAVLRKLIEDSQSTVVQATQGSNFNQTESIYTHAAVIRFPSVDDMYVFRSSLQYKEIWNHKFKPIFKKVLFLHFVVDPVGTQLM